MKSFSPVAFTALLAAFTSSLALSAPTSRGAPAGRTQGVSQDQLKKVVDYVKKLNARNRALEKKVRDLEKGKRGAKSTPEPIEDGEVDLSDLATPATGGSPSSHSTHGRMGSTVDPTFKVFFDLNLVSRPGVRPGSGLTFDNFHSFLFFEILPTPDIQFSFDVSPNPKYFELDYQVLPKLQLRMGKIWIPFDDMSPHNIFGGRVNVSRLALPGATSQFMPDIWSDLGVGFKYQILDSRAISLVSHAYLVNGFGSGGTDPLGNRAAYPNFAASGNVDNNRAKSYGGRLHALIAGKFGIGGSFYQGAWSDENSSVDEVGGITIVGADGQVRLGPVEFRSGLASFDVSLLDGTTFKRGGLYGEVGYKFGSNQSWKVLARGGTVQLDDRVLDVTDQTLIGATLLWKPSLIEYSIHHSRDIDDTVSKPNYTYSVARVVIAL